MGRMYQNIFSGWCLCTNSSHHPGGRVIVAWKDDSFNLDICYISSQMIHCKVQAISNKKEFYCTFVYAFNSAESREELWNDLEMIAGNMKKAWVILGDFNCVLEREEKIGGPIRDHDMNPFRRCVTKCELEDMKYSGCYYKWNNKQTDGSKVFCKLDRVLCNVRWCEEFPTTETRFMPEGLFDHSPMLLQIHQVKRKGASPFRFYKMWCEAPEFLRRVREAWSSPVNGTPMFCVMQRLKRVKAEMQELDKVGFKDIQIADCKTYEYLLECQKQLQQRQDGEICAKEKEAANEYRKVHAHYISFLQQKSKYEWIKMGDENTSLFHRAIRKRRTQNAIYGIHDINGTWVEGEKVAEAFIEYYKGLLGTAKEGSSMTCAEIIAQGPCLNLEQQEDLMREITDDEIQQALFSIPVDKSPGPDGFGTTFYKASWEIIGNDIITAVKDFFIHRKMLKDMNNTLITLVPKSKCPSNVSDYRPIACCNVVYKCITKVICNRMRKILPDIIAENQGAFIQGRFIGHNIMVCQDIVHGYGRKNSKPGCIIKMDMWKAYDSID
ncbi:uncharacterized protein LOC125498546 [Beta vulgaris subsp. vulgaris]|uniref:uncharacterized protein LOC125498546 n=1 Tax=Beta vulgaris subsp. vulgaris TaxID=3555 RepID=UPI002036D25C|nr:uncharacterized protein LOC125498546 [Beta vulgaris subsp. vulgaris]